MTANFDAIEKNLRPQISDGLKAIFQEYILEELTSKYIKRDVFAVSRTGKPLVMHRPMIFNRLNGFSLLFLGLAKQPLTSIDIKYLAAYLASVYVEYGLVHANTIFNIYNKIIGDYIVPANKVGIINGNGEIISYVYRDNEDVYIYTKNSVVNISNQSFVLAKIEDGLLYLPNGSSHHMSLVGTVRDMNTHLDLFKRVIDDPEISFLDIKDIMQDNRKRHTRSK